MIAKKYKLPIQLFPAKRGKLFKNAYFQVKIFSAEKAWSRFGVTISTKTAPKATERNRLKRLVYDFFGANSGELLLADYWLTVLKPAATLSSSRFLSELKNLIPNT